MYKVVMAPVSRELILIYLRSAKEELDRLHLLPEENTDDGGSRLDLITYRDLLASILATQQQCLQSTLDSHGDDSISADAFVEVLQSLERNADTGGSIDALSDHNDDHAVRGLYDALESFNMAARQALARLALQLATTRFHNWSHHDDGAAHSTILSRKTLLDFCGLARASLQLTAVREFVRDGTVPWHHARDYGNDDEAWTSAGRIPPQRLDRVQALLFVALQQSTASVVEFQRLCRTKPAGDDARFPKDDVQFWQHMNETRHALQLFVQHVTDSKLQDLSDQGTGGVTRVVSVRHQELGADDETCAADDNNNVGRAVPVAPCGQRMIEHQLPNSGHEHEQQKQQLRVASQVMQLHDELGQELAHLTASERQTQLQRAARAAETLERTLQALPSDNGPERRIQMLQGLDADTQRLLLLHKLAQHEQA